MQTHKFSLSFKENRNYIQGPDIFNEMLRHFTDKELTEIDFSIHRLSLNHQGHIFLPETWMSLNHKLIWDMLPPV